MDSFKSLASSFTNKIGLTSGDGETATPQPIMASGDQGMSHPDILSDALQGRDRSETRSYPLDNPSSNHDGKRSGEHPPRMTLTTRASVPGETDLRSKEERSLSTIQRMERENTRLRQDLYETRRDYANIERSALRYKSERNTSRSEVELAQREISNLLKTQEILHQENTQLKALLETRRQELQDAQRFMGTVDTVAESEVVQEVDSLNAETFNLARSMADQASPDPNQNAQHDAIERATTALGSPFVAVLKSTDTRGDTILLEIAIRVAATHFLSQTICTWTTSPEDDGILASVYEKIRSSENQSVVGQWRALTRTFAQDKLDMQQLEDDCNRHLAILILDVLSVARMRPSPGGNPEYALQILVGKALKIRQLIGEALKSSEYEIFLPQPEAAFAAADMEDTYDPRGKGGRTRSHVLCYVALGLRRVEKVKRELQSVTLLKAGVCLQTLLADLDLVDGDDESMST
ncbi:uncharacterized protein C8Q71DRAFT_465358 [Rhodofomes roseus]|uniref:Uncharacterized protein n=1 Tax=Rhodofomes roseus TaxID=34475 RepID=A0ABQ8KNG4_9APHY|nr:uncharacterized protein C8Q71DRAFT_465358 [Rhodofomes roseus]KAH9839851.1 hypothetical protein C8Q71DRAFT_465358 [Rhodofomes roseus]